MPGNLLSICRGTHSARPARGNTRSWARPEASRAVRNPGRCPSRCGDSSPRGGPSRGGTTGVEGGPSMCAAAADALLLSAALLPARPRCGALGPGGCAVGRPPAHAPSPRGGLGRRSLSAAGSPRGRASEGGPARPAGAALSFLLVVMCFWCQTDRIHHFCLSAHVSFDKDTFAAFFEVDFFVLLHLLLFARTCLPKTPGSETGRRRRATRGGEGTRSPRRWRGPKDTGCGAM